MTATKKKRGGSKSALDKWREDFAKNHGIEAQKPKVVPYEVVSTGSLALDKALRTGGYVRGRLYEIWGPEGAGKTSLAYNGIASAQEKFPKLVACFIDVEGRFDPTLAIMHGVDLDRMLLIQPQTSEEVADQVRSVLERGDLFSILVVDSIGSMTARAEFDKDAGDAIVGKNPNIVTRMVKVAVHTAKKSNAVVLLLNQQRAQIGSYGGGTTTPGGFALKHLTTGKLSVRRTTDGALKVGKQQVGHSVTVRVERNSCGLAYTTAQYNMFYAETEEFGPTGIDRALEAFQFGREIGQITGGGWYTFVATAEKVQGEKKALAYLRENPELIDEIRRMVLEGVKDDVRDDSPDPSELVDEIPDDDHAELEFRSGVSGD